MQKKISLAFLKIHFIRFEMHNKSENIFGIFGIWAFDLLCVIFLQSTHQVDRKNGVECYKDFFGYFNALKTNCAL